MAEPIEVWLSQPNMEVKCRIVHDDETTDELPIESLSMRGAQREITGYMIGQGYKPAGRWEYVTSPLDSGSESVRKFAK